MKILEVLAAQAFGRVADAGQSDGNQVRLLRDGAATYPAWLDAMAGATQSVRLENYIIQEDQIGEQFAQALIAAAQRGVQCQVIYDWMGCLTRTSKQFWQRLTAAGVQVRRYNPPHSKNPFGWISRDHRKVLCVDDRIAFTGGLCIGHDWAGDAEKGIAPWRDTAIEIHGPAVAQISAAFADSWQAAGPKPVVTEISTIPDRLPGTGGVNLSVIAGRPNSMGLYRLEQLVAEIVETSLWLTDGYFVATTGYVRALCNAARAGVDVRLLVPGASNWPLVGALSKTAYRPLLEAGVRVFEWNGPMLHAKTAVADGCWSRIGSSNSNLASWISNRELDVTIRDNDLAMQMQAMYEQDLQNATEVVLQPGRAGVLNPRSNSGVTFPRRGRISAGRFLSGAIGLGSTLGASLTQHRPLGGAETYVVFSGGCLLAVLGLAGFLVPRWIAYPLGGVALWFAAGFLIHAWKLWRSRPLPSGGD